MSTTNLDSWWEFTRKKTIRFLINPKVKYLQTGKQKPGECWRKIGNVMADPFHIFWD